MTGIVVCFIRSLVLTTSCILPADLSEPLDLMTSRCRAFNMRVRLGGILATDPDPDAVYYDVSHVIMHPDYSPFVNDVSLLRLSTPITYTDTILPICLPTPDVNLNQFKVCVNTGFGRTSSTGEYRHRSLFSRKTEQRWRIKCATFHLHCRNFDISFSVNVLTKLPVFAATTWISDTENLQTEFGCSAIQT